MRLSTATTVASLKRQLTILKLWICLSLGKVFSLHWTVKVQLTYSTPARLSALPPPVLWQRRATAMVSIHSKWRYFFMFLGIQLVVMALLSREGYQKRVSYFIRIFRKPDTNGASSRNHTTAGFLGGDVYANLSRLSKSHIHGSDMPYCPKTSPLIGECTYLLQCHSFM